MTVQTEHGTIVGVWGISNVASLNVYDLNDEGCLCAINDDCPEWVEVQYASPEELDVDWADEDEGYLAYIVHHNCTYLLCECMRV